MLDNGPPVNLDALPLEGDGAGDTVANWLRRRTSPRDVGQAVYVAPGALLGAASSVKLPACWWAVASGACGLCWRAVGQRVAGASGRQRTRLQFAGLDQPGEQRAQRVGVDA